MAIATRSFADGHSAAAASPTTANDGIPSSINAHRRRPDRSNSDVTSRTSQPSIVRRFRTYDSRRAICSSARSEATWADVRSFQRASTGAGCRTWHRMTALDRKASMPISQATAFKLRRADSAIENSIGRAQRSSNLNQRHSRRIADPVPAAPRTTRHRDGVERCGCAAGRAGPAHRQEARPQAGRHAAAPHRPDPPPRLPRGVGGEAVGRHRRCASSGRRTTPRIVDRQLDWYRHCVHQRSTYESTAQLFDDDVYGETRQLLEAERASWRRPVCVERQRLIGKCVADRRRRRAAHRQRSCRLIAIDASSAHSSCYAVSALSDSSADARQHRRNDASARRNMDMKAVRRRAATCRPPNKPPSPPSSPTWTPSCRRWKPAATRPATSSRR